MTRHENPVCRHSNVTYRNRSHRPTATAVWSAAQEPSQKKPRRRRHVNNRIGRSKKSEKLKETALVDLSSQKKCKSNKMRQTRHAYYPTRKLLSAYTSFVRSVLKTLCMYLMKEPQFSYRVGRKVISCSSFYSSLFLSRGQLQALLSILARVHGLVICRRC